MDRKNGKVGDFETFLSKPGTVPKDKIKFYIHWVRRFLKSCNYQLEDINTERISQYLDSLEADEKVGDWQVKQAADAVILYVEKYLKSLQQVAPPWQRIPGEKPSMKKGLFSGNKHKMS